ncbi:CynX/NimT family MFS transporter [Brevibacillus laterosporus]|uniref:CynX/NimT family MFS transporter n=1 Tax=Brevibacillus laterosporus TaxID=1465 RepID=UPI000E6C6DCA|nr:MFS transporter [Brevibacillus laterosporus]AYB39146.1 MFS transporter [Brevibacillus laterosporus]MBM7109320.1 putative transporter YycB [Brevibacillus laterosporus]
MNTQQYNPNTSHTHESKIRTILTVLGIILIAANLRAAITSVGPLIGDIRNTTGLTGTVAGMLTTLPLIAFAILSPVTPKLARRFGMEKTLFIGLLVLSMGIILRYLPSTILLFVGTALIGLAIAVGNVLLPSLIKRDFAYNVGIMTGAYSLSMGIFAALASGLSVPIAHGLQLGWRGSLLSVASLSLVAALIWIPQLQHPHLPKESSINKVTEKSIWRCPLAWQVTLFMGLQSLAFYVSISWLPAILSDRGYSAESAGWILSLMQFVSLPVSFLVPMIAGRSKNQSGLAVLISLFGMIGFAGLLIGNNALLFLWIIFIGLGQGGSISLALTMFALRAPNVMVSAELSGMAQSIGYTLAACGPILFGFLHDVTDDWSLPLIGIVVVILLQLLVGLGAGRAAYVTQLDKSEKINHSS